MSDPNPHFDLPAEEQDAIVSSVAKLVVECASGAITGDETNARYELLTAEHLTSLEASHYALGAIVASICGAYEQLGAFEHDCGDPACPGPRIAFAQVSLLAGVRYVELDQVPEPMRTIGRLLGVMKNNDRATAAALIHTVPAEGVTRFAQVAFAMATAAWAQVFFARTASQS